MSNIFGFQLSKRNFSAIVNWTNRLIPSIIQYQKDILGVPNLKQPIWGETMAVYVLEFVFTPARQWQVTVTLAPKLFPTVTPLTIIDGITPFTELTTSSTSISYNISPPVPTLSSRVVISHGYYDHLQRLNWTIKTATHYEYIFLPSGIGAMTKVRHRSADEWTTLEDPNDYP